MSDHKSSPQLDSFGIVYPRVLYHGLPKPRWLVADFHVVSCEDVWVLRAWSHEGQAWLLQNVPDTRGVDGLFFICRDGLLDVLLRAIGAANLRYEVVGRGLGETAAFSSSRARSGRC